MDSLNSAHSKEKRKYEIGTRWKKEVFEFMELLGFDTKSSHKYRGTASSFFTIPNKKAIEAGILHEGIYRIGSDCRRNDKFFEETYFDPHVRLCFYLHAVTTDKALNFLRYNESDAMANPWEYKFTARTNEDFAAYRILLFDIDKITTLRKLRIHLRKLGLSPYVRAIVESTPGKFHVYCMLDTWQFAVGTPAAESFPATHGFFVQHLGADPSVGNKKPQVIQVPGQPRLDVNETWHSRLVYQNKKSPKITSDILTELHREAPLAPAAFKSISTDKLSSTERVLRNVECLATKKVSSNPSVTESGKWDQTRNTPGETDHVLSKIQEIVNDRLPAKYVPDVQRLLSAMRTPVMAFAHFTDEGRLQIFFPAVTLKNAKHYASAMRHLQNLGIMTRTGYTKPTKETPGRTRDYTIRWQEVPKHMSRFEYEQRFPRILSARAGAAALAEIQAEAAARTTLKAECPTSSHVVLPPTPSPLQLVRPSIPRPLLIPPKPVANKGAGPPQWAQIPPITAEMLRLRALRTDKRW